AALDLLTGMAREEGMPVRYRDYRAAFTEDAACFYPGTAEPPAEAEEAADPRIDALRRENAALRNDLAALHDSRSWRLTAPLRATADRLRSMARSGR
ncbi:MAG: hypothetical protein ACREFN_01015, partial [Acetobacteraceae bacterium]